MAKDRGKGQSPDDGHGVGHIPSTSGICFNYARLGKCEKDNCTFHYVSAGQLRKALGGDAGQGSGQAAERQRSKGSERGQSQGGQNKGKGRGKSKSDAVPSRVRAK